MQTTAANSITQFFQMNRIRSEKGNEERSRACKDFFIFKCPLHGARYDFERENINTTPSFSNKLIKYLYMQYVYL